MDKAGSFTSPPKCYPIATPQCAQEAESVLPAKCPMPTAGSAKLPVPEVHSSEATQVRCET